MTHWSGLLGFGYTQQFSGIKRLLQGPLIADTDRDQANVKHLPFKERIHDYVQQTWTRTERWGWVTAVEISCTSENWENMLKFVKNILWYFEFAN